MSFSSKFVASVMFASGAFGVGGCDEVATGVEGPIDLRTKLDNGPVFNGAGLNGVTLNGVTLNGVTLNGVTLNGVTLNGVTLNGVTLNGTSFSATTIVNGLPVAVSGTGLINTKFELLVGTSTYVLTFDNIHLDPFNPAGDVYLYDITVHDVGNNTSTPLCSVDGDPAPAIPLRNHWNPTTGARVDDSTVVTFACRGGAIAKCVDWGYRPWASATRCDPVTSACTSVSLADYHQACTRMVRADYCGDGTPHTVSGTLIDVYDRLSPVIQAEYSLGNPLWDIEAEWGPNGAVCINEALRLQHLHELEIPYTYPTCLGALLEQPDCGSFPVARNGRVGNSYCTLFSTDPKLCG